MQCGSCGAQNKDEAKFCEECGKPLVPGNDEEQIERLVDYLIANWWFEEDTPPDASTKVKLHERAREVHMKWKANPRIEDVAVKIDEPNVEVDESFDGEELVEIFSGREAAKRAEERRRDEEETARHRVEQDEGEAADKAKKREKEKEESSAALRGLVIFGLFMAAVVGASLYEKRAKHKAHEQEDEPSSDKHEAHRGGTTPTPTATTTSTVPPLLVPVPVASCTCVSRANGKNTFVLEQPPAGGPWHVKWEQVSGFTSMKNGFWLGDSDAGAATSVPRGTTQIQAVMACENEIVAIVAGNVASAWTGTDRGELLWTRKLPAPYAFPKDAGVDDGCAPALGVTGNVFTVPLAKGKPVALSIRDGSIQK